MREASKQPLLFQPLQLGSLTLKNRIVVAPMCQYKSVDGMPVDWHYAHLGRYAIGGAGVVFYEETAVEARGERVTMRRFVRRLSAAVVSTYRITH